MYNFTVIRLLFFLSLPFLFGMYCSSDDGMEFCRNNFYCTVDIPEVDSVWIELYSGDTLLDVDSVTSPHYNYATLPHLESEHEFRRKLTLRIHIFCNGGWLNAIDYEFENRNDKYTRINLDYFDQWHEDSLGAQIFSDEQIAKCPELSEYRIFETTNHPPSCFVSKE